jgi:hypothetical protein
MRYTGIQPQYFPRLHYFARIVNTDIFVLRDDAQFVAKHKFPDGKTRKSFQAHTPIKTTSGEYVLTVPIKHGGKLPIAQTEVDYDREWVKDHLKTIMFAYKQALNFDQLFPQIEALLGHQYPTLHALNTATIFWALCWLLEEKFVFDTDEVRLLGHIQEILKKQGRFRLHNISYASSLAQKGGFPHLLKNEKILALLQSTGATEDYCGGTAMQAYMNSDFLKKQGIAVVVQDWKCNEYLQLFSARHPFLVNLSIIDLLMNVSPQKAREILLP